MHRLLKKNWGTVIDPLQGFLNFRRDNSHKSVITKLVKRMHRIIWEWCLIYTPI